MNFSLPGLFQPNKHSSGSEYKFIDLFAGIGGFHLALSSLGSECVFASEKDIHARETYKANFDTENFEFNDDIRKVSPDQVPDHDILCAGFPCQPFSQAGLKKGFQDGHDSERGNLFFCILDILEAKRPKAFILENVRHLVKHDDGNTFKIIQDLLKKAGYTVYWQVLKASDYNVPQHRPRVFIVGFRDADNLAPFHFPAKLPLTNTMSDIFGAKCEKDVGFTLRVGGKGSNIDDRRNWEFYRVDGEVRRIGIDESKKMMTFPNDYKFPVSKTQTMKQLGNSVCVEVVKHVGQSVVDYLNENSNAFKENKMAVQRNKGELSEIYALCKVIYQKIISYGDINANLTDDTINVLKIHLKDSTLELPNSNIVVQHKNGETAIFNVSDLIKADDLQQIVSDILGGKQTFSSPTLEHKIELLGLDKTKGTSFEKADILLAFLDNGYQFDNQGSSIKSFLGSAPTLLNASSATNFIYKIDNLDSSHIDVINSIDGKSKIIDRLKMIQSLGGQFTFKKCENSTYENTLRKVDSKMPEILAEALLSYFCRETTKALSDYPNKKISDKAKADQITCRLKDFVKSTILDIFPTVEWDGDLSANSVLLVNQSGELLFYHTNKDSVLKDFFYQQTFFDTPSSTRHRFGSVYQEDNELHIKLNLQLRF